MQRLGNPGLIQRPPARTPPWDCQVRYKHRKRLWPKRTQVPMRTEVPPFEASPLLLDLEAEGNKYVRAYNEELDGVPEPARNFFERQKLPMRKRVENFEAQSAQYKAAFKKTAAEKFDAWHISDHDIFTTTLLGTPPPSTRMDHDHIPQPNSSTQPDEMTNYILDQNGIPHMIRDDTTKLLRYMVRGQWLARRLSRTTRDEEPLEHALQRCQIFPEIKRLIVRLLQTPEGCQLVSQSASTLVSVCKDSLNQVAPLHVLSFLNDLTLNLSERGQQIPADILECGLETSLQCRAFETAQMYLKFLLEANHILPNPAILHILRTLRDFVTPDDIETTESSFQNNSANQYLAVFSLLTGRVFGEESTQPSLRDTLCHSIGESYQIYLECLAQLGAFRTMWHEWQLDMAPTQPTHPKVEYSTQEKRLVETPGDGPPSIEIIESRTEDGLGERKGTAKQEAFTKAIHFAISTSNRVKNLAKLPDFAVATGRYPEDYQLDAKTIIEAAGLSSMQCGRSQHNTDLQADMHDGKELVQIFSKRSIHEALLSLQVFLT
ncbi:hypothetical protein F5X99DRAFT_408233 [Biscogniauxia marginata]|nr:hypothetical protein F5X99DRAFT_408233 [Biscogniauxia marginata]